MTDYSVPINTNLRSEQISPTWKSRSGYQREIFFYRPEAIEYVLAGDQRYVTYMFTWADSPPELSLFWEKYQDHNSTHYRYPTPIPPLPENHKSFLRWLIRPKEEDKGED